VPALIAVVEPAGTAMTLQRHTEVVRPDRHPELPREIVEMIAENGAAIPERRTDLLPRAGLAE
jgi:hypothetical protein